MNRLGLISKLFSILAIAHTYLGLLVLELEGLTSVTPNSYPESIQPNLHPKLRFLEDPF